MNFAEASHWYLDLERLGSKPGLEAVRELARRMGDPQRMFRAIHVTGTSGKGSTSAYAAGILRAAGLRVGLFTSPHLSVFTESVQVNGEKIPQADCARILSVLRSLCEAMEGEDLRHPTQFEVLVVLGFTWFAERRVDCAVVEVGMGGRFDATNIMNAQVAVVTNVSLEHSKWLGNTVAEITENKAGIVKSHSTLVTAAQNLETLQVLERVRLSQGARMIRVGQEVKIESIDESLEGQAFKVNTPKGEYNLQSVLLGAHQRSNAATAIAAAEALAEGWIPLQVHAVEEGVSATRWPGRFEVVQRNPIVVLDGAKDLQAAIAFRLTTSSVLPPVKTVAVVGISSDKDIPGMVAQFVSVSSHVIACSHRVKTRTADPELIAMEVRRNGVTAEVVLDVKDAVNKAITLAGRGGVVLVVGSVFLVGEAREIWFPS
jgi:dihydrofolate synthase / folylpolyglutamate synthase